MTNTTTATELLNLNCRKTNETILPGEIVALHNWGLKASNDVIGYGKFIWDNQERCFYLDADKDVNTILGTPDFNGIESLYDLYRTSPRKLTRDELDSIQHTF